MTFLTILTLSFSKDNKVESRGSIGPSAASGGCCGYLAEECHEPGVFCARVCACVCVCLSFQPDFCRCRLVCDCIHTYSITLGACVYLYPFMREIQFVQQCERVCLQYVYKSPPLSLCML